MAIVDQAKRVAQLQAAALAKQKARKRKTITTATLPARQRAATIKQSKADKRAQFFWSIKSKFKLTSSFVSELDYDMNTGNVHVLLSNEAYTFFNVPEAIFSAWTKGAATCQTSDSGKKKKWWIGKTPSLGAFFNHYIKNKYGFIKGRV